MAIENWLDPSRNLYQRAPTQVYLQVVPVCTVATYCDARRCAVKQQSTGLSPVDLYNESGESLKAMQNRALEAFAGVSEHYGNACWSLQRVKSVPRHLKDDFDVATSQALCPIEVKIIARVVYP